MANFEFLKNQKEYILFANAAIEAEKVYAKNKGIVASDTSLFIED